MKKAEEEKRGGRRKKEAEHQEGTPTRKTNKVYSITVSGTVFIFSRGGEMVFQEVKSLLI